LGLLVYGYTTGVFSSRKLERATYDSVAFRFIAANDHPDHDTVATFRRRFLRDIEALFVRVLELAREPGGYPGGRSGVFAHRRNLFTRLELVSITLFTWQSSVHWRARAIC
jgi:hypothetical protein